MTMAGATQHTLSASETVYFHATEFARPKTILDSADLIHTEEKVRSSDLAEAVVAAAMLGAEAAGAVRLFVDKKPKMFGLWKSDAAFVEPTGAGASLPPGSFEAKLVERAQGRSVDAESITWRILDEDAPSPNAWAVQLVLEGLATRGVLARGERRVLKVMRVPTYEMTPEAERLARETPAQPVRTLLEAAKRDRPELWQLMEKGIRAGIKRRKELDDNDDHHDYND